MRKKNRLRVGSVVNGTERKIVGLGEKLRALSQGKKMGNLPSIVGQGRVIRLRRREDDFEERCWWRGVDEPEDNKIPARETKVVVVEEALD